MQVLKRDGIPLWQFDILAAQHGLVHFVSTREGGASAPPYDTLNLSVNAGDDPAAVSENRQRLFNAVEVKRTDVVTCTQVHGNGVLAVERRETSSRPTDRRALGAPEADALVTRSAGIMLMLMMADCVPVLLYDPIRHVAGIAHAGWSGTVGQVTAGLLGRMCEEFGSAPRDLLAGIGPSIGPCCYEVGENVISRVRSELPEPGSLLWSHPVNGKAFLDLWKANRDQLERGGVPADHVELAGLCTRCNSGVFFSDRAERPTGRFGAGIMLRPG